jgi:hypothetical protein
MKELIRQILKEYTEPKVTFKVIGNIYNSINEAAKYSNFRPGEQIFKPSFEKPTSHFKPEIPREMMKLNKQIHFLVTLLINTPVKRNELNFI